MEKSKLYTWKRYLLILMLTSFLLVLGVALEKSWHMTPEKHFTKAISLLQENKASRALSHFLLANKSQSPVIKARSAYHLGKLYHKGAQGISKNIPKAVFYYEQATNLKQAEAQYELALLYDVGDKIPENREKALQLMQQAAKTLPEAQYALAVWIERGYLENEKPENALKLYEQAAESGVQNAIKTLISIYHGGYGKFPKDIQKEKYWRKRLESEKKK